MKVSLVFNSRCAGQNHYHFTATVRNEADVVLLTKPIVPTVDQMHGLDPDDAISQIPFLIRQLFLESGITRSTPLAQVRSAIEAKVFRA